MTLLPTDSPDTTVVAIKMSNWTNPTAAMDVAPSPPTKKTATMPSARCRKLLTVIENASVITDRRI